MDLSERRVQKRFSHELKVGPTRKKPIFSGRPSSTAESLIPLPQSEMIEISRPGGLGTATPSSQRHYLPEARFTTKRTGALGA